MMGGGGARELETRMRKDGEKPGAEQRGTKARQSSGTFSFTIRNQPGQSQPGRGSPGDLAHQQTSLHGLSSFYQGGVGVGTSPS